MPWFISVICAWIAVIAAVLTSMKYIVKSNPKWNSFFHKIHIPAQHLRFRMLWVMQ